MSKEKPKKGPEPDRLVLEGDWKERVKEALEKKRPKDGWLKPKKKRTKR